MSPRSYCSHCHYPVNVCLCQHIQQAFPKTHLVILQHPSEVKAAKNTARLIKLCIPKSEIIVGEQPQDFAELKKQIQHDTHQHSLRWGILYPTDQATQIEDIEKTSLSLKPQALILLDGTWKKAYKMWQLNPWLHALPQLTFREIPENRYLIRKTQQANSLSTLEAAAYALQCLEQHNSSHLYQAMNAMMKPFILHSSKKNFD